MTTSVYCPSNEHIDLPCIHKVERLRPLAWLDAGWGDFRRAWPQSLPYGVLLGAVGLGLLYYLADRPYLTMALAGGFLLLAPVVAAVFYQISSQLEWQEGGMTGEKPSVGRLFGTDSALFSLMLAIVFAIWVDLAAITTALFSSRELVINGAFSLLSLFNLDNIPFVIGYFALGALLAGVTFSIGVVSLPMLMDRQTDLVTALTTSLVVVKENPVAMAVWAVLIAVLMVAGMLSLFIGFAVFFPVLGHATWHAYRAVLPAEVDAREPASEADASADQKAA